MSVERLAPSPWSTNVITDFLTAEEMAPASYHDAFDTYMTGDNTWVRCRKSRPHHTFVVGKPEASPWGYADNPEVTLLILLKSGAKKSWESVLKYGLPWRKRFLQPALVQSFAGNTCSTPSIDTQIRALPAACVCNSVCSPFPLTTQIKLTPVLLKKHTTGVPSEAA